jgi:radical SAM protein with 4Fe4S-binding SPASM domain
MDINEEKIPLFTNLEIEISSSCNLKCATCPNKNNKRKSAKLPTDLIYSIILELGKLGYDGVFSPHFYNEPLLDPRLYDILPFVKENVPNSKTWLFTNFTLMTNELYCKLYDIVDEIWVTTHEPVVRRAVEELLPHLPEDKLSKLKTGSIMDTELWNRGGSLTEFDDKLQPVKTCMFPERYMTIDAYGNVHLCCNDYSGKAIFGNIFENSFLDIWYSEDYSRARRRASVAEHPLCRNCRASNPFT